MKQQITKRAITESFRALLAVKPLDKITVRDIVEDCGLTRNTFYYHYEDVYDLLSDVLESEIERALSVPAGGASWETMLLDMLSFLTDSPQIGRHIFQSKCQDAMRVYLSKVISELSDRYIEQNVRDLDYSQQDRKLICDICCHALYGLLEEWLTGRSDVALEAELRRVAQLFEGTVRHALEFSARSSAHLNAIQISRSVWILHIAPGMNDDLQRLTRYAIGVVF